MKKILYTLLFIVLAGSCDILNQEPQQSLHTDQTFVDASAAEGAYVGLYDALQSGNYYGRLFPVLGDLPADLLRFGPRGTFDDLRQIDQNIIAPGNISVGNAWGSIYNVINTANTVIEEVPPLVQVDLEEERANHIVASALFVRALAHFDALRLWGDPSDLSSRYGVPVVTKATRENSSALKVSRATVANTYRQIIDDLEQAIEGLSDFDSPHYLSKQAAEALLARVYLYQRNHTKALEYALRVINSNEFALEDDYDQLFEGIPSQEFIFTLTYNATDANSQAFYTLAREEYIPTSKMTILFDPLDVRYASTINNGLVNKYRDVNTGTDPSFILRYSEILLIAAEAAGFEGGGVTLMNRIRSRAGVPTFRAEDFSNSAAFLDIIMDERARELAFEGHRWFDLIRTGYYRVEMGITENQTRFPIPQRELDVNDNLEKNPGY